MTERTSAGSQAREVAGYIIGEVVQWLAIAVVVITCFAVPMAIGAALADGVGLLVGFVAGIAVVFLVGAPLLAKAKERFSRD